MEIQFYLANRFILCSKFQNQTPLLKDRKYISSLPLLKKSAAISAVFTSVGRSVVEGLPQPPLYTFHSVFVGEAAAEIFRLASDARLSKRSLEHAPESRACAMLQRGPSSLGVWRRASGQVFPIPGLPRAFPRS